ncbi:phospho-sugar mutase [Cardiobacteriaceae bacterium TAE3-ERU3]|nr:phospho-sugar mutase [Cardiobacteriaceae bacterium TAE3-ERU3]
MQQEKLIQTANAWLAQDPDQETHDELASLIEQAKKGDNDALSTLEKRFATRLQFGTAGLRGPLMAGPSGMNRVLVSQTAAGLANYLNANYDQPSIVIGCDARKNSDVFARDTAEIMQAAGIRTLLLPAQLPTPVLAYAIRDLDTSAGVMVTASHNPPLDNGYKVYLGGKDAGAQIVPPADKDIAAAIDEVAANQSVNDIPRSEVYEQLDDSIVERYIAETIKQIKHPVQPLNYVYTAMHGVGCETLLRTIRAAGLDEPTLVEAQCTPDPTFPTVDFPNPEEPGALDLAIEAAEKVGAEFIIANDPDADRLAVAVPDEDGQWHSLHGNEIGCLLGWQAARRAETAGKKGTLACSMVSSPALAKVAAHYGLNSAETLTGFKWIGRAPELLYGYEEALGYLVDPEKVRDKDGISATLAFLDLIIKLKGCGQTLADHRREFAETFGAYASGQVSIRVTDLKQIGTLMQSFRAEPPKAIAGKDVVEFIDHEQTERKSNILVFQLEGGSRVIIRPSGTEPKVKMYLDAAAETVAQAKESVAALEAAMRDEATQRSA